MSVFSSALTSTLLSLTRAQQLALSRTTLPGMRVRVTDGFVVTGAFGLTGDGFYAPSGATVNGKPVYAIIPSDDVGDGRSRFEYTDFGGGAFAWAFFNSNATNADGTDVASPWLVSSWVGDNSGIVLTNPPIQELQVPSSAIGGMFVPACGNTANIGIFVDGGVYNGKRYYTLLGTGSGPGGGSGTFSWETALSVPGVGSVTGWFLFNAADGSAIFYSTENVARPDLVTTWTAILINGATLPAPTVASVTEGELVAGVDVEGAGDATVNGTHPPVRTSEGRILYSNADASTYYSGGDWRIDDTNVIGAAVARCTSTAAFPWGLTYTTTGDGTPPAPTLYRNDVCAWQNWRTIYPTPT